MAQDFVTAFYDMKSLAKEIGQAGAQTVGMNLGLQKQQQEFDRLQTTFPAHPVLVDLGTRATAADLEGARLLLQALERKDEDPRPSTGNDSPIGAVSLTRWADVEHSEVIQQFTQDPGTI